MNFSKLQTFILIFIIVGLITLACTTQDAVESEFFGAMSVVIGTVASANQAPRD